MTSLHDAIDTALSTVKDRTLVPTSEVIDLLLDIRSEAMRHPTLVIDDLAGIQREIIERTN